MDAKLISLAINSNTENSDKNILSAEAESKETTVKDLSVIDLALVGGGDLVACLF